jgi:hypothetical protein
VAKTLPALLTSREVQDYLRLSSTRVSELVASGVLKPVRITPRGNLRFKASDIELLVSGAVEAASETAESAAGSPRVHH